MADASEFFDLQARFLRILSGSEFDAPNQLKRAAGVGAKLYADCKGRGFFPDGPPMPRSLDWAGWHLICAMHAYRTPTVSDGQVDGELGGTWRLDAIRHGEWRQLAEDYAATCKFLAESAEVSNEPLATDLTPVQDAIYRTLTSEYQSAVDIADSAGVSREQARRELPNLNRFGLVEHKNRVGYRKK